MWQPLFGITAVVVYVHTAAAVLIVVVGSSICTVNPRQLARSALLHAARPPAILELIT